MKSPQLVGFLYDPTVSETADLGLRRTVWHFCLWPENPVSRQQRLWSAKTRFGLLRWKSLTSTSPLRTAAVKPAPVNSLNRRSASARAAVSTRNELPGIKHVASNCLTGEISHSSIRIMMEL
jgi:hypothetical protein